MSTKDDSSLETWLGLPFGRIIYLI